MTTHLMISKKDTGFHRAEIPKIFKCLLFMLGFYSCLATAARIPENISFQNILENKDIAMGEGASVFQDSEGFMWLGGGSTLIRFDGYEFHEIFISNPEKPNEKLPVNFARAIYEDHRHHALWVGTRAGLLQYDTVTERLTQVKDDPSQTAKLTSANILDIDELSTGELLIASGAGLFVFDPVTAKYTLIAPDKNKSNWLQGTAISSVYVEKDDVLWLGSPAGLEKMSWKNKTFTLYKMNPEKPDSIPENGVSDVIGDGKGKYWVATSAGLTHYDPQTQQATRYQNNPNDRFSLGSNDVWRLLLDSQGVLWVASDGGGLSVFDEEKNNFINHKYEAGRLGSMSSDAVRTVYEDRNGDIWTGNFPGGINFFDRSSAAVVSYSRDLSNPNSLGNNAINPIAEDKNGNLWLGIDGGGLDFFDREHGKFTHFKMDPNDPNTLNGNSVLALCVDSGGLIWTGVWGGGMASYNPADKKFTRYPYEKLRTFPERVGTSEMLNNAHVWSIREDKNHEYWITTFAGGMSKFDPKTKRYTHYMHIDNDPESISSNFVWTSLEDSNGNLWVGAANGLNLMDKERSGKFSHFAPDKNDPSALKGSNVLTLFEDSKKRLWVGTDSGLSLRDATTGKFTTITKSDGLLNDAIRKIIEDSSGTLWIGTNNGFSSFNPETKAIKNYNRAGGRLIGAISNNSGTLSRSGEIIFGGTNGLRIVNTAALSENKVAPLVALTDFKIFADSIAVGGQDGILQKSINHTDKIVLNYTKSLFVFNFSALNFRESGKNKYAYKLDGFDKDWVEAGAQRSAKYTNLDAGTYTFRVKGSNNDGVWSAEDKAVTIIQLPPPWKTWWAYTLYALAVLSLLAWFLYSQRRKRQLIEEQNRILEVKVLERTAEVREKSKDIQAMLSNMPQGLFTVQGGGEIHPEYSQFLESIFETSDIAGRDVADLLFQGAAIGSDALDSAKAAIFAIIGEDEMNFEFNESLLLTEYTIDIGGNQKCLSLGWSPIIADDVVAKLMVSVRDVTLVKQLESAALEQKRQLDIVSQLLNLTADKYLSFEVSAARYVKANREAIEACKVYDTEVIALLFRNMHTIKGNCRTLGFSWLSNTVHEVESSYSALKSAEEPVWSQEALLNDIALVEKGLAEYAHVYHVVLGRSDGSGANRSDGFWMKNAVMSSIKAMLKNRKIDELEAYVNRLNAATLEQTLVDVIGSLESIAAQLDKPAPIVSIEANNLFIREAGQELMRDIFAHILRNAVDHGLESPSERIRKHKNEQGALQLRASVQQGQLNITIKDDGRGLNIKALFGKGVERGVWQQNDTPTSAEIAKLIFVSGVSTKEQITDISGRGVGMDAVKQFLMAQGGDVVIKLAAIDNTDQDFIPFELSVTLPAELFFEASVAPSEN